MDRLSNDVLRYITSEFLTDRDRLSMACVNRQCHEVSHVDVTPPLFDEVLDASSQTGVLFDRSTNGYWGGLAHAVPEDVTPYQWGRLAAERPWVFLCEWMAFPLATKDVSFRRQCVESLIVQAWHKRDVLVSVKALLSCQHPGCPSPKACQQVLASTATQLLRQAVWVNQTDVVCYLLDVGKVPIDIDNGTALRLALSTLGLDFDEQQVATLVHELLRRGADPIQYQLWGIRMCLQMNFHVVASLLCVYAAGTYEGYVLLNNLVREFLEEEGDHDADVALVRSTLRFYIFCDYQ